MSALMPDSMLNLSMMKFSTKGSFSYNGKDLLTDITFDATKDIEGKASLKTPMTEDIIVAFSHEGVIFPSMSLVASNVMSVDTSLPLYDRDPFVTNFIIDPA
jgi:hypothetical protein